MLRFSEWLLLLPPLVLGLVMLRTRALPTSRMLVATLMVVLALGSAVAWFGASRGVDGAYVPARLQDGRVLPGHGSAG